MSSHSLSDCEPRLAETWRLVAADYAKARPDRALVVTCTKRGTEEQQKLFQQGRVLQNGLWVVDADPKTQIVTQIDGVTKKSNHNYDPSRAIDYCVVIGGKVSWDPAVYAEVGRLARTYGLVWGGDWPRFKDYPHIELKEN